MKETMLLNRKIYKNKMGNHKQHKEETKIKISKTKKGIIPKSNKDLLLWIEKNGAWNKGIELPQLSGENHPNWLGGKSFEPYNKTFNNRFKKAIRKRDNRICLLCEIHSEKLKRVLDIHHINYDKLLSIPENCISLCNSCHMKTNFNRNHWTKFFQSLLSERYGYIYSEIGEPVLQLNNLINM